MKPVPDICLLRRIQQTAGESPIDNLQLPNLMNRNEALLLTTGHRSPDKLDRLFRYRLIGLQASRSRARACANSHEASNSF